MTDHFQCIISGFIAISSILFIINNRFIVIIKLCFIITTGIRNVIVIKHIAIIIIIILL